MHDVILPKSFYQKNTLDVAKNLLGCFLVRKINGKIIKGMITETEAYMGEDDLASHASKGRTPRTEIMYGEAGRVYVYMIYGMYFMLNVVTERKNFPAAVLIRVINPLGSLASKPVNGPGKLCKFLKIDQKLNGWDLTKGEKLWIEQRVKISAKDGPAYGWKKSDIKSNKRIGVDYAKHCKHYLWRFYIKK